VDDIYLLCAHQITSVLVLSQLFTDSHGSSPSDRMSMGAKTEYVKSLRAKALLADAKAASMLQLEEVRLHLYRIIHIIKCRIVQG
jgi:hypothetical protein